MSAYYFINNNEPTGDPNIDLNFDNDLLYSDIIADDYDKYREARVIDESIVPYEPAKNQPLSKRSSSSNQQNGTNIYVIFIIIIIVLIFLWYIYGKSSDNLSRSVDTMSYTSPDLVMLSPNFGNGVRFGHPMSFM